jgi:hypothetical protein
MTPYERELFFELLKKFKDDKKKKDGARFKDQVKFLVFLVVSLVVILALLGLV